MIEASPAVRQILDQAAGLPAADLRLLALAIARRCADLEAQYASGCRCGLCDPDGLGDRAERFFGRRLGVSTRVGKGS